MTLGLNSPRIRNAAYFTLPAAIVGASAGLVQGIVSSTNRKLAMIAYTTFCVISVFATASINDYCNPFYSTRDFCLINGLWNIVEATIAIYALRKLGLIGFKGSCVLTSVYTVICFHRLRGYVDEVWRNNEMKMSFFTFTGLRKYR